MARLDGRNPWNETFERERYYRENHRSAVTLLRNLGDHASEAITASTTIALPHGWVSGGMAALARRRSQ